MPIVKCKQRDLQVGQFYLAYSAKSKMLSSNGNGGVIVQYVGMKEGHPEIKVWNKGVKTRNMTIRNMDTRKDAFMVAIDKELFEDVDVKIGAQGGFAWPNYTERMQNACDDNVELKVTSIVQVEDRFPEERIDGTLTFICETKHDGTLTYLNNFQVLVTTDMVAAVCSAEELEERKRQEALEKVAKLKEGGVRLQVGKMELGQKQLPKLLKYREEVVKAAKQNKTSCATYSLLYGEDLDKISKSNLTSNGACHSGLSQKDCGQGAQFVISAIKHEYTKFAESLRKESALIWIDYLVNRSLYADIFVDKDLESVYKLGFVLNGYAPSNAVSAAITSTRHLWEYAHRVEAFIHLRKHMDEHYAYFVAMCSVGDLSDDGELTNLKFNGSVTGHTPIPFNTMPNMAIIHHVHGAPADGRCNPNLVEGEGSYSSPNRVYDLSHPKDDYDCNTLYPKLSKMKLPKVDTGNPFEMAKGDVQRAIEYAVSCVDSWREDNGDL